MITMLSVIIQGVLEISGQILASYSTLLKDEKGHINISSETLSFSRYKHFFLWENILKMLVIYLKKLLKITSFCNNKMHALHQHFRDCRRRLKSSGIF